jgi:hypothetical protein
VPVAQPQPLGLCRGEEPFIHAQVDHRPGHPQHRGDDRGVAGEPPHRLGREQGARLGTSHGDPSPAQAAAQRLQVDGDENADNGPNAASSTALPSGSRVSRYSATPISSTHGCDRATYRFATSCSRCSWPSSPYFASSSGRSLRHCRGPPSVATRINPSNAVALASSTSTGSSLSASDTTTAAPRTGNTPDSTASLTGAFPGTANACATATTWPDPPATVDGACLRTHCTGDSACGPDPISPRAIASVATITRADSPATTMASAAPITAASSPDPARHSSPSIPRHASTPAAIRVSRSSSGSPPAMD